MSKPDERDLPPHILAEAERIAAMPESEIDFSDIPRITDFSGFRRGPRPGVEIGEPTFRFDPEVVDWFEAHARPGETAQAAIDRALREVIARGEREAA